MNIFEAYNKNKYKFWLLIWILSIIYALLNHLLEFKKNEAANYVKIQGKIINVLGSEDNLLGREMIVISLDDGRSYRLPYGEIPFLEKGDIIGLKINISDVSNNKKIIYAKSYKMIKEFQNVKIKIIKPETFAD